MKQTLRFSLVSLALCALVLWMVQGLGLTLVQVRGPSMIPSYTDGQVLFVNRLAYGLQGPIIGDYLWIWKAPNLGDPVIIRRTEEGFWVVKRVAGLPGSALRISGHKLQVENRTVDLSPSQEYWMGACTRVPSGSVFVLGDNLAKSRDSRDWGFVPLNDILGRAMF